MSKQQTPNTQNFYSQAIQRGLSAEPQYDLKRVIITINSQEFIYGSCTPSFQSVVHCQLAENKHFSKIIFQKSNLPTAKYCSIEAAQDLPTINDLTFPLVMKPLKGVTGTGVITGIADFTEAQNHYLKTAAQYPKVLFEEHLQGEDYRVTCVKHKVSAIALRVPAYIIGDGKSTIAELVSTENKKRENTDLYPIILDDVAQDYLTKNALNENSIPQLDEKVTVRGNCNLATGGVTINVPLDEVHPQNIELFEKVSRAFSLDLLGLDVMAQNLEQPITTQEKAGLIEVNHNPDLMVHFSPYEGESVNIYDQIIDIFLDQANKNG